MNTCACEARLTSWLLGDLPAAEADAIRRHLADCASCRALAAELEPVVAALRTGLAAAPVKPLRLLPSRRRRVLATPYRTPFRRWWSAPHPALRLAAVLVAVAAIVLAALFPPAGLRRSGSKAMIVRTPRASMEYLEAEAGDWDKRDESASGLRANDIGVEVGRQSESLRGRRYDGRPGQAGLSLSYGEKKEGASMRDMPPPASAPPAALEPQPQPFDAVAQVKSPVILRSLSESSRAAAMGGVTALPEAANGLDALPGGKSGAGGSAGDRLLHKNHGSTYSTEGSGNIGANGGLQTKEFGFMEPDRAPAYIEASADDTYAPAMAIPSGAQPPASSVGWLAEINLESARRSEAAEAQDKTRLAAEVAELEERAQTLSGKLSELRAPPTLPAKPKTPPPVAAASREELEYRRQAAAEAIASGERDLRQLHGRLAAPSTLTPDTAIASPSPAERPVGGEGMKDAEKKSGDGKRAAASSLTPEEATIERMKNVVIPEIDFRQANVNDIAGFFKEAAKTFDDGDASPPPAPPPPAVHNPFVATRENPFSTFAIDVDTASYTRTRQALSGGALPDPESVRTEEIVNAFDYGDSAPENAVFRVYIEGAPAPFGAGLDLLRIGVKGRRLGREEQRPAMLTFLVDSSGSMDQPDRIGLARQALALLLEQLSPRDRLQLIAFDDHARLLLEPTPGSAHEEIMAAFARLQCRGSTNLEEGMRQAYAHAARAFQPGAENRVILISDGVANLGSATSADILAQIDAYRRQGITCSVFGVGRGVYNDHMLEELANRGDGAYRFLDSQEEVRRAFVDDLAATLNTIATDVKIQVEWDPAAVVRYRQLGYENRALTKEQFRDDTVDAGEVGSGQSVTALYEIERAGAAPRHAPLGMVRVRYRRVDTQAIEEIAQPILPLQLAAGIEAARPELRLAAGAAEFAELLRRSPHAAGGRFADVARLLHPVALELKLDTRVAELLLLVEMAGGMAE